MGLCSTGIGHDAAANFLESEVKSKVESKVESKGETKIESTVESEAESRVWGGSGGPSPTRRAESHPEKILRGKNLAGRSPARFFPRPSVEQVRRSNRCDGRTGFLQN